MLGAEHRRGVRRRIQVGDPAPDFTATDSNGKTVKLSGLRGKTVVLARFVPIIRTFAPFVAGVGRMHYPRFLAFDVGGGILWVWSFGLLGYFFGNAPIIKENFGLAIIGVILISLLPIVVEYWRARRNSARSTP